MRTTTHRNRSTLQTIRQVSIALQSLSLSLSHILPLRHNRGHVTRGQFRQCLAIAGLPYSSKELEAVEAAFIDDDGFGYRRFLEWIQTPRLEPFRYNILQQELKDLNKQRVLPELKALTSIQDILQKIKGQVKRERIEREKPTRLGLSSSHSPVRMVERSRQTQLGSFTLRYLSSSDQSLSTGTSGE